MTAKHVVVMVLVLPGAMSLAATRTWTSRGGTYTTEAELLDFENGQVKLRQADGGVIDVPLVSLCEEDLLYVKDQFPGVEEEQFRPGANYREWKSRGGGFTTLAEFLDYSDGKLHLREADGEEIFVPLKLVSPDDQRWVREELRSRREAEQEGGDEVDEEITEQIGPQTVSMKLVELDPPVGRRRGGSSATMEYMLLMTKPQHFYMQMGNRENPHEAGFQRIVSTEPNYNAPVPFRAVANLGSGQYAFALDAVGKNAAGYNQLYFDANQNGDLTDDRPIPAADVQAQSSAGYVQSQFPRFDVQVEADGVQVDHAFLMSVLFRKSSSSAYASASLYAGAVREGQIMQGGKKIKLMLVDHNSNGRFDDPVSIRRSGSRVSPSEGDLLLVNPNPKNRLSTDTTMGRDRHFVSKTVCIGKHFYKMEVSPAGDQLKLEPTELAIGYVANPSPAYRAVMCSDDYGVLLVGGTKDQKIPLPECQWQLVNYTIDATAFTGGSRTAVTAAFSDNPPPVTVGKDETVTLPFGAPFRPVVTASRSRGDTVYLSLAIVGVGGERCTSFYVNGRRPPQPSFEIRDQDGKVVHQGKFEYG